MPYLHDEHPGQRERWRAKRGVARYIVPVLLLVGFVLVLWSHTGADLYLFLEGTILGALSVRELADTLSDSIGPAAAPSLTLVPVLALGLATARSQALQRMWLLPVTTVLGVTEPLGFGGVLIESGARLEQTRPRPDPAAVQERRPR